MYSKRLLLSTISLLLLLSVSAGAQKDPIGPATKLPDHPRILLLKGEEGRIRQTIAADKTWNNVHQAMLGECDKLLAVAPVERIQIGRRLLDKSREALRRVFLLAYAWRLTGQQQYLQRVEKELLAVSAFSDWNPSHFLDVAEMTMAVGIGYDWLYNDLSPASRSAIKAAILKKGIEPSLDPKFNSWLTATHNWNQVCNAGMTYGAMAIYEDQPELSRKIINRAIDSIELPMEDYAPDGAYPEGYSYWGYGTSFNVMFISAIEKAFGSDFGLSKKPGFLKTAAYMTNMTGPTGNSFNYSDAGTGSGLHPAMFWFASKLNDPSVLWVERGRLLSENGSKYDKDRLLPAIMLWNNGIRVNDIPEPKARIWVGDGKSPVALMRTSWTDPSAIFVGLKAGSPSVNHAHMDVGSFVMEADGVRWAMDFGMQDYNSLESKGVKLWGKEQDSQRWQVYRYNNYVHNTLTVNNGLQNVEGNARITRSTNNPQFLSATTDLTELYKGPLHKASRGIAIVDQNHIVVRDEVETPGKEATVRWTLLTPADVTITGKNRAELTKDGKKLILQVQEPANVTLKTWSTDPPHEYDAPNPGTTLVGFEVTMPANTKGTLTVLLLPEKAAGQTTQAVRPLAQWPK
ncbi:Heparinase II/III family protein [Fibrisoma limi BUZ 3]|uniref:Heparinase II/III family protein n=1 Tax=Fibrisoma limi BUZ 3 TaxID=1185876 RepID=I2GH21_9BACT|nr:heparinase II/III family protein [Fibrisoma limi]CCH53196.1 Heparinase II/III family protein [Fibrisoma limi BUZ 3]